METRSKKRSENKIEMKYVNINILNHTDSRKFKIKNSKREKKNKKSKYINVVTSKKYDLLFFKKKIVKRKKIRSLQNLIKKL